MLVVRGWPISSRMAHVPDLACSNDLSKSRLCQEKAKCAHHEMAKSFSCRDGIVPNGKGIFRLSLNHVEHLMRV